MSNLSNIAPSHSWYEMQKAVQRFHDKNDLKNNGGEELHYRIALMAEELGEISSCVTKGKGTENLAEEVADLLILLMGTAISAKFDLNEAFWKKIEIIMDRKSKIINGTIRISNFSEK
jgi:NTP pyrophosphatase (non-canonical NTP hydrolase)